MKQEKLPNFFIVGAPKAGTTSLHAYLDQHPEIYMSPLKETNFFCTEVRAANFKKFDRARASRDLLVLRDYIRTGMREKRFGALVTEWHDYAAVFRNVSNETAIGETTPLYLWSSTAARNIAARFPEARIIILLRNPIERAYSNYLHLVTAGAIHRSFRQQIEANLQCRDKRFGDEWPFLELGHYHHQLQRYLREFPRSQIHVCFYDDLASAPGRLLAELYRFLGVDPQFPAQTSLRHNEPAVMRFPLAVRLLKKWQVCTLLRHLSPPRLRSRARSIMVRPRGSLMMSLEDRTFLCDYYRDEVGRLGSLLKRDLNSWLEPAETMTQQGGQHDGRDGLGALGRTTRNLPAESAPRSRG